MRKCFKLEKKREMLSSKSLHLEYRIWIAELNFDINLIRIFNDCLDEILSEKRNGEVISRMNTIREDMNAIRTRIDNLRHRMHIEKMNLASLARDKSGQPAHPSITENYNAIRNDFFSFRIAFNDLKNNFSRFESSLN
jgi:hypothetical protein